MRRHPTLQPLSREHHTALVLASACERAAQGADAQLDDQLVEKTCRRAVQAFESELEPHFRVEEQSLLPLLAGTEAEPLLQRTLEEHRQLRGMLTGLQQGEVAALGSFGAALKAHVRFEERELFPALERLLGDAAP